MKRGLIALLTFLAVATARAADLATTFYFSPSLNHEANPLVKVLGFGWTALLVSQAIVIVFLCLPLTLYWLWPSKKMSEHPATVWEFASLCLYNRRMTNWKLIKAMVLGWPLPRDWRQTVRLWGFVLPWVVVIGSWMCVFSWWAVNAWAWSSYRMIRSSMAIGYYSIIEPLVALAALAIAILVFFRMEFKQATQMPEDASPNLADPQH